MRTPERLAAPSDPSAQLAIECVLLPLAKYVAAMMVSLEPLTPWLLPVALAKRARVRQPDRHQLGLPWLSPLIKQNNE